jgi:hypothetical protein
MQMVSELGLMCPVHGNGFSEAVTIATPDTETTCGADIVYTQEGESPPSDGGLAVAIDAWPTPASASAKLLTTTARHRFMVRILQVCTRCQNTNRSLRAAGSGIERAAQERTRGRCRCSFGVGEDPPANSESTERIGVNRQAGVHMLLASNEVISVTGVSEMVRRGAGPDRRISIAI